MSRTKFVEYRDEGFWAYDVALGVFLKYLIDLAQPIAADPEGNWLSEAISHWRISACISDLGFVVDSTWSSDQVDTFLTIAENACSELAKRDWIPANEVEHWDILDGEGVFARGDPVVTTQPVIELGRAIIDLVRGTLRQAPPGTVWFLGTPNIIAMADRGCG